MADSIKSDECWINYIWWPFQVYVLLGLPYSSGDAIIECNEVTELKTFIAYKTVTWNDLKSIDSRE